MKRRPKLSRPKLELLEALRAIGRVEARGEPPEHNLLAKAHLDAAQAYLTAIRKRRKKTRIEGNTTMSESDLPSELGAYSDGDTVAVAFHPDLIGCGAGCSPSVSGGLGSLAVAGLPSYLFTKRRLSNPVFRRRLAASIEAMTPKMRRRVLERLRSAVSVARVSGAVRGVYPTVAGNVGWSGITVSGEGVGRCPYASVAGAFTP